MLVPTFSMDSSTVAAAAAASINSFMNFSATNPNMNPGLYAAAAGTGLTQNMHGTQNLYASYGPYTTAMNPAAFGGLNIASLNEGTAQQFQNRTTVSTSLAEYQKLPTTPNEHFKKLLDQSCLKLGEGANAGRIEPLELQYKLYRPPCQIFPPRMAEENSEGHQLGIHSSTTLIGGNLCRSC
jgi:hypothetical protein